jgi:hypothetical protein
MRYTIAPAAIAAVISLGACSDATAPSPHGATRPAVPAPAARDNSAQHLHSNTHETFALTIVACNGETVLGTVDEETETNQNETSSGNAHFEFHLHDHMAGIGSVTGARYEGTNQQRIDINQTPKNMDLHISSMLTLIGQGKVPDSHVHLDEDFHFDENGQLTHTKTHASATCK